MAYHAFTSGHLISLDKQPGGFKAGVGETWQNLITKYVLRITAANFTNTCKDDQLCAGLKEVIDGAVQIMQFLWGNKLSMENWVPLLVDVRKAFKEIKQIRML